VIEFLNAKNGAATVRADGRFLASSVDPIREAANWVNQYSGLLPGLRSAIVLGLGAGHHLAELKKAYPHLEVICLEHRKELIDQFRKATPIQTIGIELILCRSLVAQGLEAPVLSQALRGTYSVLRSSASQIFDQDFYNELQVFLAGRSRDGLNHIARLRGLAEVTEAAQLGAYSFRDLNRTVEPHERERSLIYNALEELVL